MASEHDRTSIEILAFQAWGDYFPIGPGVVEGAKQQLLTGGTGK